MSTRDDVDDDSMSREPLTKQPPASTKVNENSVSMDERKLRRKKYMKWGIGILILIAVILAIVLPISLSKGGGGGGTPTILPHYNPYKLSKDDVVYDQSSFTGVIRAPVKYNQFQHLHAIDNIIPTLEDGSKKLSVDS